jgi:hypothetical protein
VDGDVVSLTIANIRLYHIMIDGGVALNLMSLAAFQKLQIPMSRLSPSRPFSGVSPGSIIPRSSISLLVTFGTPENYRTKSVVFDATVNLPFNTIIGRPVGYLVLKMSSPNDISKIRGDHSASVSVLEKLQEVLVAASWVAAGQGAPNQTPSRSHQRVSSFALVCSPRTMRTSP